LRFAVVGGDERAALLCALLCADGHKVKTFALERARLPEAVPAESCLQSCVYAADCVVLPLPSERSGLLNSPLSDERLDMGALIKALWAGQIVCGGKLSEEVCAEAAKGRLHLYDVMKRPDFTVGNAAISAEGALGLLISSSPLSLWKSRVLVTGWGRIGSLLCLRLMALGARVTVAARSAQDRAMAGALGIKAVDYPRLEAEIGDFDFIVNTVPARVISDAMLCCIHSDTPLLELASPPGGFDRALAENIGLKTLYAPGLPGKSAPYSAAVLMREAIYGIMEEVVI